MNTVMNFVWVLTEERPLSARHRTLMAFVSLTNGLAWVKTHYQGFREVQTLNPESDHLVWSNDSTTTVYLDKVFFEDR